MIAGDGPERERLAARIRDRGSADRIEMVGRVDDERLLELYAGAAAVFYAPFDEDYGYVTVEAFKCAKPVVTTVDAGGVLEFVEDGLTGLVTDPDPRAIAASLDRLCSDAVLARRLGEAGRERVAPIDWQHVIATLTQEAAR